jgi:hypothetical protein
MGRHRTNERRYELEKLNRRARRAQLRAELEAEPHKPSRLPLVLLGSLVVAIFVAMWVTAIAHAAPRLDPALILARVCVKEAGFDSHRDCVGIWTVLDRVGSGDVVRGARAYSHRVFEPSQLGRRPWIAYLREDGSQPKLWPASMAWTNYRVRWLALIADARTIIRDRPQSCPARHWGDHGRDHLRAVSYGWRQIDCGATANEFWVNPRLLRAELAAGTR